MAGDSLLSRNSQGVRLAPSSNPDVVSSQSTWPADKPSSAEEAVVITSGRNGSGSCGEQQKWDLVALKVLLADEKPGCDTGTDLHLLSLT